MSKKPLMGLGRNMIPIPVKWWQRQIMKKAQRIEAGLNFMSADHHQVRNFVVRELPRVGEPLPPETISQQLNLTVEQVNFILADLEKHKTFLFRNEKGAVAWAYPVTVDNTPHQAKFSTGEQVYSAWAVDAFALPFVQGQLQEEPLSVIIRTECAHCARPMQIEIDYELKYHVLEEEADPMVFAPIVNHSKLPDPSIIDAFWRKSVFFWSEEHAREHRRKVGGIRGLYLLFSQCVYMTPIIQGALFAFNRLSLKT